MSATPGIAVFDIGKTNKKFFFFDEDYRIVEEECRSFDEIADEDGFPCDDIGLLTNWVRDKLTEKLKDQWIDIRAVNFSTYGASFAHLDRNGETVTPLYNYLKPFPSQLEADFYSRYGGNEAFATTTASPVLGNLNSGLQLYRLKKEHPGVFRNISHSLHLPQYMGYLVHGNYFSDLTSIGCHTALWDFDRHDYHQWVINEELPDILAPIVPSTNVVTTHIGTRTLKAGIGLHDSSAAFIPYMQIIKEPFILLSTGTWSISMNAFNDTPLTAAELKQDCLCYLTYKGTSLKSSRLFLGNEHEAAVKKLAAHFNVDTRYFHGVPFDASLDLGLIGPPSDQPFEFHHFKKADEAYHHLVNHLVKKQKRSTALVLEGSDVKQLYVDGGFARNDIFMHLLSRAFPGLAVFAASVSQATAVGAALAIHPSWNTKDRIEHLVAVKRY